jgi:protein-S-isoprenylcysteine O-methyltransferase Ste14
MTKNAHRQVVQWMMTLNNTQIDPDGPARPLRPPFLVRRRTVFTWLVPLLLMAAVLVFHLHWGGLASVGAGLALVIMGEAVRFWAAGYIAKDAEVSTGGPYGYVRNPLYFGSLLLAIGYGLISGLGLAAVAILVFLFLVFHLVAISYEETFLTAKFGAPYQDYVARVPRLVPTSLLPRTRGPGGYAWSQALHNREHISALFAVVFVIALALCRHLVH